VHQDRLNPEVRPTLRFPPNIMPVLRTASSPVRSEFGAEPLTLWWPGDIVYVGAPMLIMKRPLILRAVPRVFFRRSLPLRSPRIQPRETPETPALEQPGGVLASRNLLQSRWGSPRLGCSSQSAWRTCERPRQTKSMLDTATRHVSNQNPASGGVDNRSGVQCSVTRQGGSLPRAVHGSLVW
jgi:hypothetical protein